jgi:DNA-binding CsgD family transcriptional regulator/pimeloyl-ACP methyl ester carboxylesterase
MSPEVEFATTADGRRIAYCTLGEGAPLVVPPAGPWSTIELEWQVPALREWYGRLAVGRRLIRYDLGGTGLSEGGAGGFRLTARVEDLAAVVDALELGRFALFAPQHAGPAAIAYAAHLPVRVTHLLLWCTYARGADYFAAPQSRALHVLRDQDWALFTEAMAHARLGWSEGALAHRLAALVRRRVPHVLVKDFDAAAREVDVAARLGGVRAATTVFQRRALPYPELPVARALAAGIAGARLVLLDGDSIAPFLGDGEAALQAIEDALVAETPVGAGGGRASAAAPPTEPLSARELEVLRLLAAGLSNAEIAERLVISTGTAKTHLIRLYRKLEVGSRTRAVARARALKLVE